MRYSLTQDAQGKENVSEEADSCRIVKKEPESDRWEREALQVEGTACAETRGDMQ